MSWFSKLCMLHAFLKDQVLFRYQHKEAEIQALGMCKTNAHFAIIVNLCFTLAGGPKIGIWSE